MSSQDSLLTLPREVRDKIYSLVLSIPAAPPVSPTEAGVRYEERVNGNRKVLYPVLSTYNGNTLNLLHCNRQIRQELCDYLKNPRITREITYELDLMLQGCTLWPTWTNLPYPATAMEHLEVNLRLFNVEYGGGLFWGSGGPGLTFVVLFRALNRLLHHGPRFLYQNKDVPGLKIGTMTINILHGFRTVKRSMDFRFRDRYDNDLEYEEFIKQDRANINNHICSQLRLVMSQGLLAGKIQTLRICHGEKVEEYETSGIAPSATPSEEWKEWGFIWGVDEGMKVTKIVPGNH